MIKTKVEAEINPFAVPEFARMENHDHTDAYDVPLSSLDSETLDRLCDEFRKGVFAKAKKVQPPVEIQARYCMSCERALG